MDFDELMDETPDPIIPFGIHCGKYASQIPVKYLDWLIGTEWIKTDLENQIHAHLKTRDEWKRM